MNALQQRIVDEVDKVAKKMGTIGTTTVNVIIPLSEEEVAEVPDVNLDPEYYQWEFTHEAHQHISCCIRPLIPNAIQVKYYRKGFSHLKQKKA